MNTQDYISSGIVESYVLGLATPEDRAEFERLCSQHPELVEARRKFEIALETEAAKAMVQPPTMLKEKILLSIRGTSNTSKIINMESRPGRRSPTLGWIAAASIILFLLSGYLAYVFYDQSRELRKTNKELEAQVNSMAKEQELMHDPKVTVVNLVGLRGSPSSANVYWDSTSPNVYLVVKNMPLLPSNKQYQLWALIDNKPLDLGSFDAPTDNRIILKMKNTQKADAFAITVENRGNTAGPTLDQLKAMGKARLE